LSRKRVKSKVGPRKVWVLKKVVPLKRN
jgi:hypothetical protein